MSRLCRLKTKSHGDDGQWAYNEIVSLRKQRDELLAALNFARQGYQASYDNGEPDDVEWAEMYLRSIDVAIARAKGEQ